MSPLPTILTARLQLRPFTLADAPRVQLLAGERRVAATTAVLPHPYPLEAAESWINTHEKQAADNHFTFAICLRETGELIGCCGIGEDKPHRRAELGYWIGIPWWGHGYCTEAARAVVKFTFDRLPDLHKVTSCHFADNPASGRVMQKLGMTHEGLRRDHFYKWDQFHDMVFYGLLRQDWHG